MKNNLLNNAYCYTCGNLETTDDGVSWRDNIEKELSLLGIKTFNPLKECYLNQPSESLEEREKMRIARNSGDLHYVKNFIKPIIRRDLRFVDLSTFIICNIEPSNPTWGTPHELVVASNQSKPTLFHINDKNKFPIWLCGLFNVDLIWDNWGDLFKYIIGINSGEIYADPKYWKILSENFR